MYGPDLIPALVVLPLAVVLGLLAHELAHALALRLAGIEYDLEFLPDRSRPLPSLLSCPWARVVPRPTGLEAPWTLRVAALMPLTLVLPVVALVSLGAPVDGSDPMATVATIGWLACAIPSPQDFSVVWYAHRVLDEERQAPRSGGTVAD